MPLNGVAFEALRNQILFKKIEIRSVLCFYLIARFIIIHPSSNCHNVPGMKLSKAYLLPPHRQACVLHQCACSKSRKDYLSYPLKRATASVLNELIYSFQSFLILCLPIKIIFHASKSHCSFFISWLLLYQFMLCKL